MNRVLVAVVGLTVFSSTSWAQEPISSAAQAVGVASPSTVPEARSVSAFMQATAGELRRTYTDVPGSFSDPEGILKGGVQFQIGRHLMIAPAIGGGFNLDEGGASLMAEVEINFTTPRGGFVGAGVGAWDLNDSANSDGTVLVHAGVPLVKNAAKQARLLFIVEGRLFTSRFDDVSNNYQYGAGFRWVFR
jgi:hypothetical protein